MVKYQYGHFQQGGTEFVVTKPDTPRAFDNFLWNETVMSAVQQTGVGYMDYQIGDKEAVQLFTGNGRVCDFDIFGRDTLMSRLIYIRDRDTGAFWNLNWEPACVPYESFACVHGLGYSEITNRTNGVEGRFRLFVPEGKDPVELWRLRLLNPGGAPRRLSVFVYCQFQFRYKWGFDSYGDMLFRSVRFSRENNAVVADKHPHVRPHDYLTAFLSADRPIVAYDGTRDAFVGLYGGLQAPAAVLAGACTGTPGSSDATVGAIQMDIDLSGGEETDIELVLGVVSREAEIADYRAKYIGRQEAFYQQLTQNRLRLMRRWRVETPDGHFDRMVNYWMKEQAAFGAAWCRWGWSGYRDIVQHGMGVSAMLPERTRWILTEALRRQYAGGLAVRGWNPLDTKAYSDSALWLVFTLAAYLKETDDMALLAEVVPYLDEGEDTVLAHVERALGFLEEHRGAHGLCLIKFGDWNDSLTAVGRQGRGESVWLSEAYAEAQGRMAEVYARLGLETAAAGCRKKRERMLEAINASCWDGRWYLRCFDDAGEPVGSHVCDEGRIFAESQAWALICGAARGERAQAVLDACDELLLTPQGYRLLTPTFTRVNDRIGRISSMEPGICENGTIYSHANIWFILGLLRLGKAEEAYALFQRITSGYVSGEDDKKQKCPPYVYANCYYGPDHKNNAYQMEFSWITGSISWFNTVMLQDMLGVQPDFDGLRLAPCVPAAWRDYTVERQYQNAVYRIEVQVRRSGGQGHVDIRLDGRPVAGERIPSLRDGGIHRVEVVVTGTGAEESAGYRQENQTAQCNCEREAAI